jgi:hypothetical protein
MYCPRCAKEFESGTSYCRTCGLSLDAVATIVKGEAETEPEFKTGPNSDLTRFGIGTFILGTVIALGNAMVRDLGLWPYDLGKYVFMMFIMVGMLLIAAGVVFPKKKYIKRKHGAVIESDQQMKLKTAPLDQLPSAERSIDDIDSIIRSRQPDSVTEPTTRHLR